MFSEEGKIPAGIFSLLVYGVDDWYVDAAIEFRLAVEQHD
jgi:hypothetical protein